MYLVVLVVLGLLLAAAIFGHGRGGPGKGCE